MRIAFLTIGLLIPGLATAQEEDPPEADVAKLRETISKIVDVKSQTVTEKNDWKASKASMQMLLDVQRRELELLNEELEKSGQSAGNYEERKQEIEADLEKLREARRTANEVVATTLPRALALAKAFPKPLGDELENEILTLEEWDSSNEIRNALQAMLAMFSAAEQFNRRVTVSREELNGREVDVIYLGLARGYYSDRRGNSGIGVPSANGWVWTERPEISDEVVKALDELDRKRPRELVDLPVQILTVE